MRRLPPTTTTTTRGASSKRLSVESCKKAFLATMRSTCHLDSVLLTRTIVEATEEGADIWDAKSAKVAERMIRRQEDNYMVHVNKDDGTRVFQPWGAGFGTYTPEVRAMTARGYEGFAFGR